MTEKEMLLRMTEKEKIRMTGKETLLRMTKSCYPFPVILSTFTVILSVSEGSLRFFVAIAPQNDRKRDTPQNDKKRNVPQNDGKRNAPQNDRKRKDQNDGKRNAPQNDGKGGRIVERGKICSFLIFMNIFSICLDLFARFW